MKTAVLLPGWTDNPTERRYTNIIEMFQRANYDTRAHNPLWDKRNTNDWVNDLLNDLPEDTGQLTLFGFSMGAMTALLASTKAPVHNLILCSPSGYFKEYEPLFSQEDVSWQQENIHNFDELSAKATLQHINVQNGYILVGDKELRQWPDFKAWTDDLQASTGWNVETINQTGHEIEAENYQQAISELIKSLD